MKYTGFLEFESTDTLNLTIATTLQSTSPPQFGLIAASSRGEPGLGFVRFGTEIGGGEGSRTPVLVAVHTSIYMRSW